MLKAETLVEYRARDTTSRPIRFYGDLPGALLAATFLVAGVIIVFEALLAYRLYHQLMGDVPDMAPATWLFSLSALPAEPFRGYETGAIAPNKAVFEFAVLMAMEVYLVWGLLCLGGLYYARRWAAHNMPNPWVQTMDAGPVIAELALIDRALESGWTDLREGTHRLATTDWKAEALTAKRSLHQSLGRIEDTLIHPGRRHQHT
jgi:hypothetical protein